jgi:hypothetical protein
MSREVERYILEINGLDGGEVSVFVPGAGEEPMSACYAIVWYIDRECGS